MRALGPEPFDPDLVVGPQLLRFVGSKKPLPLDLDWGKVGPPSPTWPPEFEMLWPAFLEFLEGSGLPTPLDPACTWLVASPSADKTMGLRPILVSLPGDQVPYPGAVIVARRPQDTKPSRTFTVSPLGGFRLPLDEAKAAASGAVASGSAWIGEVWKL